MEREAADDRDDSAEEGEMVMEQSVGAIEPGDGMVDWIGEVEVTTWPTEVKAETRMMVEEMVGRDLAAVGAEDLGHDKGRRHDRPSSSEGDDTVVRGGEGRRSILMLSSS
ncbi:hypothetical protein GUJ93_ZPchr0005g15532 [Zizania palustris]|uniref:Uncharacterized protein n=1 Tax=Zizania palustris TaxID=103762 RepID=A0A8J5W163_ZIZPA|nr:hypothetical protein GUJ93_ZPchr0005g15532 [Zizania palustris]